MNALVRKGKSKYTLLTKREEEKEVQRKMKQMLKRTSIPRVLWGHVTKQVLGFVEAAWEIHSQGYRRQLSVVGGFSYVMQKRDVGSRSCCQSPEGGLDLPHLSAPDTPRGQSHGMALGAHGNVTQRHATAWGSLCDPAQGTSLQCRGCARLSENPWWFGVLHC